MTSSNGSIFRVTGPLCGEFTGDSQHRGQWRGALMLSFICVWINGWVNNREAGDLRRCRAHYDVTVMEIFTHYGHVTDLRKPNFNSEINIGHFSRLIVYPTVYSDADQRKHQSSASLAFVRGIHRSPVNSPHGWPVTQKIFHSMTSPCSRCH